MTDSTDLVDTAVSLAGLGPDRIETMNRYIRSQTSIERAEAEAVATVVGF